MAGATLTPRIRVMVICDGVRENESESGVFHLRGVHQGISAAAFPFRPMRLSLFVLMTSARPGEFPAYVRVVNDRDDKTVFYANFKPRPMFPVGDEVLPGRVRLHCSFPEAGRYSVQLWFFQEQGSDVLKGELPFLLRSEGA